MLPPPATPEAVAKRNASVRDAVARVGTAAEAYADASTKALASSVSAADTSSSQAELVGEIKKLLAEVQGPFGAMFDLFGSLSKVAAIRCLLEMGVFTAIPASGTPATADEILSKLEVDAEKALLVRLLRVASTDGPLVEVGEETYAQTPSSSIFAHPDLMATFKHIIDEGAPSIMLMPQFFIENGWKQPTDPTNCPYTFAHRTGGDEMWTHIAKFPERQKNSNRAMKAQSFDGLWSVGLFPFAEKIKELGKETDASTPLVVDIGGGAGHTSSQIRELCKEIKGTIVLQDLQDVVVDARPTDGVVTMAHDFFKEQPVKGAPIYFLRRILHDWSDPSSVKILKHIADAMDRKLPSRLVIAEQILPTRDVTSESALVDLLMMTFTGMERTAKQWEELLVQAGLKVVQFYKAPGTPFGAVEAVLA
ncbi:hypothetical protein N8I77_009076 [Diaporthe amygdali]|uniref:O-methyltransferase domain-containing protein n=1 Tax=Phomopsis amygdali TaxID=1214568 RepID=A0AAD9SBW6_PHOAM|nr:hypothetical protein N8I77_009076 [Diaporthe amygdali]